MDPLIIDATAEGSPTSILGGFLPTAAAMRPRTRSARLVSILTRGQPPYVRTSRGAPPTEEMIGAAVHEAAAPRLQAQHLDTPGPRSAPS
jgi:hypothetical protein